jgi:hypothetical protein
VEADSTRSRRPEEAESGIAENIHPTARVCLDSRPLTGLYDERAWGGVNRRRSVASVTSIAPSAAT